MHNIAWFVCGCCHGVGHDSESERYQVKGFGTFHICESCLPYFRSLLQRTSTASVLFVQKTQSSQKVTFETMEELKAWIKDKGDFEFGFTDKNTQFTHYYHTLDDLDAEAFDMIFTENHKVLPTDAFLTFQEEELKKQEQKVQRMQHRIQKNKNNRKKQCLGAP